jgi:hypothetical protein
MKAWRPSASPSEPSAKRQALPLEMIWSDWSNCRQSSY